MSDPTYDEGGVLPTGVTIVCNDDTGQPEAVDPPPATPVISTFERDGKHGWTCELCGWLGLELGSEQAALKEAGRHLVNGEHPKV